MYTPLPATVRARLLRWFARNGRDLPWRRTADPYAVLVSEVMAQQTQIARVVPAFTLFLSSFPSLHALAQAPLADVLRAWAGLGYNRRALALHRLARTVPSRLPDDVAGLLALPGVGPYTAAAVLTFAFGRVVPFADTNIRRVLGRLVLGRTATVAEATDLDSRYLAPRRSAKWHAALMDLGATVCVARRPRCTLCPLATLCRGRGLVEAPQTKRQPAYATSDRRVRGAIVAALRDAPDGLPPATLGRAVGDERTARLADRLVAEGLVAYRASRYRLEEWSRPERGSLP